MKLHKYSSVKGRFWKFLKYIKNSIYIMENSSDTILLPPPSVKNMTVLDRSAFTKNILVPSIIIEGKNLNQAVNLTKKYLLKLVKFNPIRTLNEDEQKQILLNPELINNQDDIKNILGIDLKDIDGKFSVIDITLNYDNWKSHQILQAVLPDNSDGSSGFSIIGHILHLNLREHLHPYKYLIAEVYLDKLSNVSLVVNKVDIIDNSDNTFRSFSMEKLAGDNTTTVTSVKENNCTYKFDFSKVYWNPRLSTEHERIVGRLKTGDILFDVMAGVGPFAIPAAKKHCFVYANDLNPASFESLKENCKINKVNNQIRCFNMDGHEFIKTIFKDKFYEALNKSCGTVHITMNLPSIAVDFLPSFKGLYNSESAHNLNSSNLPIVHLYLFSYSEIKEFAMHLIASKLGFCSEPFVDEKTNDSEVITKNISPEFLKNIIETVYVRKVAPSKIMFRVSFYLPEKVLINKIDDINVQPHKKLKI